MIKAKTNKAGSGHGESPLAGSDIERLAETLKALGNPARLRIVNILSAGERTVSELCAETGLKQSLVSQQLKILRYSNIVRSRKDVPHIYYSLKERNVIGMLDCLSRCGALEPEQSEMK